MILEHTYQLTGVQLYCDASGFIHTRYEDGSTCVFGPPLDHKGYTSSGIAKSFIDDALEMGYTCPYQYAREHEIAHHVVAHALGMHHSPIVWDTCHGVPMSLDEPHRASEEHLVNRLQRFMQLGEHDPFDALENAFENRLSSIALGLVYTCRPWLTERKEW